MQKILLSLVTLTLLGATAQARTLADIKQSGTIRIATEGTYAPYNMLSGKTLSGFEVDLANALVKRLGLKAEWVTAPFDGLLIGLQQDRYDFVIASHAITPERQRAVDFTNPHYCAGGVIISRAGGPKTLADLRGKLVAVEIGTTYAQKVQQLPGVKALVLPKDSDAQTALLTGRVPAWVGDKFNATNFVRAQGGKYQLGGLLYSERDAMAVRKGNSTLVKALNTALAQTLADGTYGRLSQQYFQQDIRCK